MARISGSSVSRVLVSVVVPTYNRLGYLKSCLRSLFSQSLDGRFYEVIVVDDGSSDGTGEFVRSFQKKFSLGSSRFPVLRYFGQCNGGPAAARNLGARHASGEFLAFLDDDCVAHRSWLAEILKAFDRFPAASYIGGYIIPVHKIGFLRDATAWKRRYGRENYGRVERLSKGPAAIYNLVFTDNSAIRKSAFLEMKGFNTKLRFGEDSDLCCRLLNADHIVYIIYSILVDHIQRDTVQSLFKRQYDLGRLAVTNYFDHYKGYTAIGIGSLIYHHSYKGYTHINIGSFSYIFVKSGLTICLNRNFFKDMLLIFLLSFFWPILGLMLFLIKILDRYIFETKTVKATLSCCLSDLIVESGFFVGNIAGSLKHRIIRF